jgi:hypothetical protein
MKVSITLRGCTAVARSREIALGPGGKRSFELRVEVAGAWKRVHMGYVAVERPGDATGIIGLDSPLGWLFGLFIT